ncbi:MAG: 2-amino-4,5-dihydroxy-6-one-heptanoic acid-7-phosphate synthase, partial [Angustibacter sp.]
IVVAGGPRQGNDGEVLRLVMDALAGGAIGVAMGRNLFQCAQPQLLTEQVARLVHQGDHSPPLRKAARRGEQPAVLA